MRRLLISICVILFMTSCSDYLLHEDNIVNKDRATNHYIVYDINSYNFKNSIYLAKNKTGNIRFLNWIEFVDVSGKYAIGDTIILNLRKN